MERMVTRAPRWLRWAHIANIGGSVLGMAIAGLAGKALPAAALFFFMYAGILGLAALTKHVSSRVRTVRIADKKLEIDGETIPVHAGVFVPGDRPFEVRLFDKKGRLLAEIDLDSEEEAKGVLRELGLDATARSFDFRGVSQAISTMPRAAALITALTVTIGGGFVLGAAHLLSAPVMLAWVALTVGLFVSLAPSTHIRVGADGVAVRWLGARWFFPYSSVRDVEHTGRGVRLVLEHGSFELRTATVAPTPEGRELLEALEHRVRDAFVAWRARDPAAAADRLAIGDRTLEVWLADLEKIANEERADYRSASLSEETLWRVLEDGSADPSARAAAARILRPRAGAVEKIRDIAGAIAAPQVRVALESIAGDVPEEEVMRAFESVSPRARSA
jgi:hypothetical protein